MTNLSRVALMPPALLAVLLAAGGCGEGEGQVSAGNTSGNQAAPVAEEAAPVDTKGGPPSIRQVMNRLARPGGLTTKIGEELKADPVPWDKLQPQAEEYAKMAAGLGQNNPPRGSKESWAKYCSSYADSATALEKAAQAKDKAAVVAAHQELLNSCQGCHQDHRRMGGRGKRAPEPQQTEPPPAGTQAPDGAAPPK